jgi:hypothetical protein
LLREGQGATRPIHMRQPRCPRLVRRRESVAQDQHGRWRGTDGASALRNTSGAERNAKRKLSTSRQTGRTSTDVEGKVDQAVGKPPQETARAAVPYYPKSGKGLRGNRQQRQCILERSEATSSAFGSAPALSRTSRGLLLAICLRQLFAPL